MLRSKKTDSDSRILKQIKEVHFFKMYADSEDIINKIAKMCTVKKFKKGSSIIKEGEPGDELYIMLTGEIEIVKETLQKEKYTVVSLKANTGGIYVGEFALLDNDKRSATVIAKTDCECLELKRDRFIKFGDDNPEIGLNITRAIAQQLSTRIRKTNMDVITLFSALVDEISTGE
ncbi:MAG: cyclic nucleotide-binding domain-containing protein [Spirochaetes bacterium]|jgi:CRP-like cAMP-binding protein|nr:cyclic nucleotide-binding domain-containing protein [Spirochaetota bacterium]